MKKFDFFVSYSSVDKEKVIDLVNLLERSGAKCWFAPRDVVGRYAKSIVDAIDNARIFLLCLSNNSVKSEHVLNEIEMAYSRKKFASGDILIEPVCIENIDIDDKAFDEIMYYIRRLNFIMPENINNPSSIASEVIKNNKFLFDSASNVSKDREESLYHSSANETKRLVIQNNLLKKFDCEVYKKVFSAYKEANVLDIGCGDGDLIIDRLKFLSGTYKLVGIDREQNLLDDAKKKYPDSIFCNVDLEGDDFSEKLEDIMSENKIASFDIINISMVLLHLKNMCKLFRILRRHLNVGGTIIIKDVDDGLNFAYPDDDNSFERLYKICRYTDTSGERRNGRQIYTNLCRAGFKDISLEAQGFSSIGMTYDEREDFFNLYCRFILKDAEYMHKKYPDNINYTEDCEWCKENSDRIFEEFMKDDFVFSVGLQMYLAKK